MITFFPGESKIAIIPLTIKPVALDCQVEIYIGPNEQTKTYSSGLINFVSTGQQQNLSLTVVMPEQEGVYHVYIDTYVGGIYLAGYISNEDIEIGSAALPFSYGPVSGRRYQAPGSSWSTCDFNCTISNPHSIAVTHTISFWGRKYKTKSWGPFIIGSMQLRLEPGESYQYSWVGATYSYGEWYSNPLIGAGESSWWWIADEDGGISAELYLG